MSRSRRISMKPERPVRDGVYFDGYLGARGYLWIGDEKGCIVTLSAKQIRRLARALPQDTDNAR